MSTAQCPFIIHGAIPEPFAPHALKRDFENGTDQQKITALKTLVLHLLNGEHAPQLLVPIIRYLVPSKNHNIKKLLLLYWELVAKDQNSETMLLVCNALLRDVNYPNEYVRGSTLRFLTKLKDQELLLPLIESIRKNLDHRQAYVRRNAVLAIYSIFQEFPNLIQDGPELILDFLDQESDPSCKRNAFLMLFNTARNLAIDYLNSILDQVPSLGEIVQLLVVEMIRKIVKSYPQNRAKYSHCIFSLLTSPSSAVQYEAAQTIVILSAAPGAIKGAAGAYVNLLVRESDNNVKMIVLDRLMELKEKNHKILQSLVMDILGGLHSPDQSVRNKVLQIALDLVNPTSMGEVVNLLKKDIHKTQSETSQEAREHRRSLIKAIHSCAVKFPEIASDVVHDLIEFSGDENPNIAWSVIEFVREVMYTHPQLRSGLLQKLFSCLNQIRSGKVHRSALWIIGEYSETALQIEMAFHSLEDLLGDPLLLLTTEIDGIVARGKKETLDVDSGPKLLPDGTYATSSALSVLHTTLDSSPVSTGKTLKQLLQSRNFFVGSVFATSLTKLSIKYERLKEISPKTKNVNKAKVLLYLTSLLRLCSESRGQDNADSDLASFERILSCFKILTEEVDETILDIYLKNSRESFARHMALKKSIHSQEKKEETPGTIKAQVDDLIKIRLLKSAHTTDMEEETEEPDLDRAIGRLDQEDYSTTLNRIVQLTGWSDPIYAEASVNVHQYDILLDVTVINQTGDTLQNLCLELSTLGDLQLLERPTNYTLGPYAKRNIKANIKISSTETGTIFGSITYEVAGASTTEKTVQLNEIRIDLINYISPATTDDSTFRKMWVDLKWENKVTVNTDISNLHDYLNHIVEISNMACLTPSSLGEHDFLSANLYSKSTFDEDTLANVSIGLTETGNLEGLIRIRSKTHGINFALGEKIKAKQRNLNKI